MKKLAGTYVPSSHALQVGNLARPLLRWFDRHRRDLPWRQRQSDAYAQLVAEVMLQQTQVATVLTYYERFLDRFPTVEALAGATLDEVLPFWAGLGYYSRARNLHAAAQCVVNEHGGRIPASVAALMSLPGVGRYTAGAVASIAFGLRAPALDGNVGRVLLRLTAWKADLKKTEVRRGLWKLAEDVLPAKRCGDFNQAMMELGATVCTPRKPSCGLCPVAKLCRCRQEGKAGEIPAAARQGRIAVRHVLAAVVSHGDKLLFVRRPETGLWAGLWEPPTVELADEEPIAAGRRRLVEQLPSGIRLSKQAMGEVARRLTHRKMIFHLFVGAAVSAHAPGHTKGRAQMRWVTRSGALDCGISRACEAVLRLHATLAGGREVGK